MPVERPLDDEEEAELERYFFMALELLPIDPTTQGEEGFLIAACEMLINALRQGAEPPDGASQSDVALWLGVLWGEELCRLGGWNWIYLITDEGLEGAAVVDPRRSRAIFPIFAMSNWMQPNAPVHASMQLLTQLLKQRQVELPAHRYHVLG
ncbi:MAG: hypothetical protein ACON4U_03415 [Myxococcota bacterium]